MLKWASLLSLALKVALWILQYLERHKALKEGEFNAIKAFKEQADAIVRGARVARDSVDHSPDAIMRDEWNLDANSKPDTKENSV